jgi:hypothetical protein
MKNPRTRHLNENMTVMQFDELTEESQEDFITAYTEDKYVSTTLKNVDIIEYKGAYYKIYIEDIVTETGMLMGSMAFFSFMLFLVVGPTLLASRRKINK